MMSEPFLSAMALTIFLARSIDCSLLPPLRSGDRTVTPDSGHFLAYSGPVRASPVDPVALRTEAEVFLGSEYVGWNPAFHCRFLDLSKRRIAHWAAGEGSFGLQMQLGGDLLELLFQLIDLHKDAVQPAPTR